MLTIAAIAANVLIYGFVGWAIVGWLGRWSHARVAGLFLAVGFAIGSFGGHAATEPENLLLLRAIGSASGLCTLSVLMLVRRPIVASHTAPDCPLA